MTKDDYLKFRFLIAIGLLLLTGFYMQFRTEVGVRLETPLEDFPVAVHGWLMVFQEEFSPDILDVLKPTDYLSRAYARNDGALVNLYIGYYGGGSASGEIHSPKHCLPGSGWHEDYSERLAYEDIGYKINMVRAVYQKGESRELIYYWYQVHGGTLNDEFSLKMAGIINSLLNRRRDSAFVRISIPVADNPEHAEIIGEGFLRDFIPAIRERVPT